MFQLFATAVPAHGMWLSLGSVMGLATVSPVSALVREAVFDQPCSVACVRGCRRVCRTIFPPPIALV